MALQRARCMTPEAIGLLSDVQLSGSPNDLSSPGP